MNLTESAVEKVVLKWFKTLGYAVASGADIAPGSPKAERDSFGDVVLSGRLRKAVDRLNPDLPGDAREEAVRKVLRAGTPSLAQANRDFHRMLRDGVEIEHARADGSIAGARVRLADFDDSDSNDFLAVNQFTVVDGHHKRRADIVLFLNGLPVALFELKNPGDENATV